ncbi:hypothetical protein AMK22_08605 [Streptomyces sp. CB01580]|nr:hypothetical protein AMK22_08605 [Streptomyces sp. CB01580]
MAVSRYSTAVAALPTSVTKVSFMTPPPLRSSVHGAAVIDHRSWAVGSGDRVRAVTDPRLKERRRSR